MAFGRWLIGGLIGGFAGAVVWVAIGYYAQAELGIVAWGIGLLCGMGVQVVGGEEDGIAPGVVALGCAALSILIAKYLVVSMMIGSAMAEITEGDFISSEDIVAGYAEEIIESAKEAGRPIQLSSAYLNEDAPIETQYPAKVWRDAEKRWDALSESEQAEVIAERKALVEGLMKTMGEAANKSAFRESFEFFDLVWFGLAAFTAFRVGSGLVGEE